MDQQLRHYQNALTSKGPAVVAAATDLLSHHVCPRCCLRLLSDGSVSYAQTAPSNASLLRALTPADDAQQPSEKEADDQPRGGSELVTCPACLGLLQSLDADSLPPTVPEGSNMPDPDFDGGKWVLLPNAAAATLQEAVQKEDQVLDSFSLEVTVPLSVAVREVAVFRYLAKHHPKAVKGNFSDAVVTAKEVLRLTLQPPLTKAMGHPCTREAPFRLGVMFAHPSSSGEPDRVLHGRTGEAQASSSGRQGQWGGGGRGGRHGGVKRDREGAARDKTLAAGTGGLDQSYSDALKLSADTLCSRLPFPPPSDAPPPPRCHVLLRIVRRPLLLGGRYLKLKRGLPQTPFMVEEGRYPVSVEDILSEGLVPFLKAEGCKLYCSGREDIDVRMLGNGRPFVIEVINARAPLPSPRELEEAELAMSKAKRGVEVRQLHEVDKEGLAAIKEGEEHKEKTYEALCWINRPLTPADVSKLEGAGMVTVQQATPVRVLHRRAPLTREKTVRDMKCVPVEGQPQYFKLRMTTSAGTYVKEFVNGDLGRTVPSVGSMLDCHAEILQLDVLDVHLQIAGF